VFDILHGVFDVVCVSSLWLQSIQRRPGLYDQSRFFSLRPDFLNIKKAIDFCSFALLPRQKKSQN
jgi:hypothetical protein